MGAAREALPELADVPWRTRADALSLRRADRLWTVSAVAHTLPFIGGAIVLGAAGPILIPFALLCLAHAWAIPELYAARGARVVKPLPAAAVRPERVSLGLLGDLVGHEARELHSRTGLMLERGVLGVWLIGQAGALLVCPGGGRVRCYCVKATDPSLPAADRIAHLLLALRTDEHGLVTVANLAFSGARWRVRRRLSPEGRIALDAATDAATATARGPRGPRL